MSTPAATMTLRAVLQERGLSQRVLALMIDTSTSYLNTVVQGKRPGWAVRTRIARALEIDPFVLWPDHDDASKN